MNDSSTDRVERRIFIAANRSRVWRALTSTEEFGRWFGCNLAGQSFTPGRRTRGAMTIKGFEHVHFDVVVERLEPETLMSYRWHPYAVDPAVDYEQEEPTLVTFTLSDAEAAARAQPGTLVTVVETGFDKVPPHRRMEALRMNGAGWTAQVENLRRYVTAAADA